MHDPSFMALAIIVSEKMTSTQKTRQKLRRGSRRRERHRESNTLCLASASQARQTRGQNFTSLTAWRFELNICLYAGRGSRFDCKRVVA